MVQRLKAEVDAGRDNPADIGAIFGDHIKGGGGAEIHHDQVAAVALKGACGIHKAVWPDGCALIHAGVLGQVTIGLSNHIGAAIEIAVAQDAQVEDHARHGGRDDHLVNRDRQFLGLHQRGQPDEILIGRALPLGRGAPGGDKVLPVPDRKDGVGIARINAQ